MLYVVATPIGNLKDITERAREVLCSVSLVACEDTRHSQILLKSIGSSAKTISFHAHSDKHKLDHIIEVLLAGEDVALISDAGTPGLADPGGLLVEAAHAQGIKVSSIPGPSSIVAALSVSGFVADQFVFLGFIPKKKGRQTLFNEIKTETKTVVLFESPHRITKTIADLAQIVGLDRRICICRELTKHFEEIWAGTLQEASSKSVREQGEFVLVIEAQK